jgi:hypothetical protein
MKDISVKTCQQKISLLWIVLSGLIFIILIAQSVGGHYDTNSLQRVWSWILPIIMPTLALVVAVGVVNSGTLNVNEQTIDSYHYYVALALSFLYLLSVLIVILFNVSGNIKNDISAIESSSIWLGPLQGVVTAAMATFFIKTT